MSAVTEMVGQTNATDPDPAFANLVLSHVSQLPKRFNFCCQNEINQVLCHTRHRNPESGTFDKYVLKQPF